MEKQLTAELKKVRGKEGILFKLADAAVGKPDEIVRTALYPVVGEKTLRDLVAEAKADEKVFKAKVRTMLRSSYSSYYRQMLPPLLKTLGFKTPFLLACSLVDPCMTDLVERLVPDELWTLFRRVVPPTDVIRP
ncbi:hypothetical protein QWJ26_28290, partial [Streptomyces sp. CSDS2]|nr:hypothetical protein [Streptomyces sp. CSDS2]